MQLISPHHSPGVVKSTWLPAPPPTLVRMEQEQTQQSVLTGHMSAQAPAGLATTYHLCHTCFWLAASPDGTKHSTHSSRTSGSSALFAAAPREGSDGLSDSTCRSHTSSRVTDGPHEAVAWFCTPLQARIYRVAARHPQLHSPFQSLACWCSHRLAARQKTAEFYIQAFPVMSQRGRRKRWC